MKHRQISSELGLELKEHSIDEIEKISKKLGVHPISALVALYLKEEQGVSVQTLLQRIKSDLDSDSDSSSDT
ncbi:hypothetical protein [Halopseudomonas sabulinigri]|uniref:hypothetical protein n=1 Tax=Halopseudomonas sabulinigri TaxID=472181 RepID=UPI000B8864D9|nr:hypothetical protein [Halopseudomonas sabulinigri]